MSQIVVITGGEGGFGSALAKEFTASPFHVFAPGRQALDVSSAHSVNAFFASLPAPVSLLINNAGHVEDQLFLRQTEKEWDAVMTVNLKGAWRCAQAVLPGMATQGHGHIINVASFSALSGPPGQGAYAASKAALLGLTHSLAAEVGAQNIRVNAIMPGFLETKMTQDLPDHIRASFLKKHVLGRFNTVADAARFTRFLHTDLGNVSGQFFQLDSRPRRPGW